MFDFTVGFSEVFTGPAKAFQGKDDGGGGKEAAITFGKGFGKMVGVLPKATLVDFPLAMTEGLHHMPRLYGEEVRDHGQVKDWKSGGVVAGKVSWRRVFLFFNFLLKLLFTRPKLSIWTDWCWFLRRLDMDSWMVSLGPLPSLTKGRKKGAGLDSGRAWERELWDSLLVLGQVCCLCLFLQRPSSLIKLNICFLALHQTER